MIKFLRKTLKSIILKIKKLLTKKTSKTKENKEEKDMSGMYILDYEGNSISSNMLFNGCFTREVLLKGRQTITISLTNERVLPIVGLAFNILWVDIRYNKDSITIFNTSTETISILLIRI